EFFETAVHHYDLWRFLLNTDIEAIFATSRSAQWDDESVALTARLANGALAVASFSTGTCNTNEVEIYGEKGRLRLSFLRFDGFDFSHVSTPPGGWRSLLPGAARTIPALPSAFLGARQGGAFIASSRGEWRHFAACIRHGIPVACSLEDGRRALTAPLAALESASTGTAVAVAL